MSLGGSILQGHFKLQDSKQEKNNNNKKSSLI